MHFWLQLQLQSLATMAVVMAMEAMAMVAMEDMVATEVTMERDLLMLKL